METLLSEGHIAFKYAVRIQTVLNRARGRTTNEIAEILGINNNTVSDHVRRFNQGGVEALLGDKTRLPGKEPVSEELKDELTRLVCQEKPENATHWSTRELGKKLKISHTAVSKILKERGLKPHIVKKFQLSTDKEFERKLKDVVGLYLEPPENSIVFCVDEKTQIQALERTQPILPMRPGIPERQTHDYERHGTTVLFAALNVASGKVIGNCTSRHTSLDYVEFLKLLDKKTPKGKTLHIIADNVSSHKAPQVKEYLRSKEGRFVEHYIPTYSSWLNLIERWFAEITNKRIRRESWSSLKELETAIIDYIISWNKSGRKFVWTKKAEQIEKSIEKAKLN
ncbi:IS630 family transposase [Spirochaetia bacterium]|nr:IS630 family transposase [Spirochaetia bacterium]